MLIYVCFLLLHCCFSSSDAHIYISAGIVSSNTKDVSAKVMYPHLNYSIPVTVFQGALQHFEQTKDTSVFRVLDVTEERVRRVWRLQVTQSKM